MDGCRENFARTDAQAKRLEPIYREMYLKAAARDVDLRRQLY